LSEKFGGGARFMFVVPQTHQQHAHGAGENRRQFEAAPVNAVSEEGSSAGIEWWNFFHQTRGEQKNEDRQHGGNRQGGHDGYATRQRHGLIVDFPVTGIIDKICAQTPFSPKRQRQQRREKRPGERGEVDDCKSHSSAMLPVWAGGCQFQIKGVQRVDHAFDGKVLADKFAARLPKALAQGRVVGKKRQFFDETG